MDVSREQKILKIFSTISLVLGLLGVIGGILMLATGGLALGNAEAIMNDTAAKAEDLGKFSGFFIGTGVITIIAGIISLIDWSALKKVAKDATKYKPALILTMCSFVLAAVGFVLNFVGGSVDLKTVGNNVVSLGLNGYILYLINKVKSSI